MVLIEGVEKQKMVKKSLCEIKPDFKIIIFITKFRQYVGANLRVCPGQPQRVAPTGKLGIINFNFQHPLNPNFPIPRIIQYLFSIMPEILIGISQSNEMLAH
jgi:hypothetical protein